MYKKLIDEINKHKTIIIHRHENPDGDAYGSQHGLSKFIKLNFENKKVFATGGDESKQLKSIFPPMDNLEPEQYKRALVIVVDTANINRISGEFDWEAPSKIIKIDHHPAKEEYGHINFTDPKAASASEIIADIYASNKKNKMDEEAALYLYTGMVTDTNRFMFESVTPKSLELASYVYQNIKSKKLRKTYNILYNRPLNQVRFNGYLMQNMVVKGKTASIKLVKGTHKKFDIPYEMAASSVNTLLQSSEITYAAYATFDEKNNFWRVSLRSKAKPVNTICSKYGGGGHKQACGIKIKKASDFNKIVRNLKKL